VGVEASILISSHDRIHLLRRTLYSIASRPPSLDYEVVIADDESTDDILGLLREFSSRFKWVFARLDRKKFEEETGLKPYANCPSWSNNVAFQLSSGRQLFQMGNECIAYKDAFDHLLRDQPDAPHSTVVTTTFDMPQHVLDTLDPYGSNLSERHLQAVQQWPLQSEEYRSDVTSYLCLIPRHTWEAVGGYDERLLAGVGAEDSCWVRRARLLPGFRWVISRAVSCHQFHGGRTRYYPQKASTMSQEAWDRGVRTNRVLFDIEPTSPMNPQPWPAGKYGVVEVIRND
jgi:GT2 family glycosyltransferase